MRSATQLKRLLNLVPYLVAHQGVAVAEAARHFGVTERQILSDLEVLQFCGLPDAMYGDLFEADLDGAREDGYIFFRNADVLARPMRLNRQEATSLLLALEAVAETGESDAASSAMAKLRDALGAQEQVISLEVSAGEAAHRRTLARAIEERRAVELTYSGSGRAGTSRPVVEPVRLRVVGGRVYLDAWSRPRSDWRSFRLDRVEGVAVLKERFEPRTPPADEGFFADVDQDLVLLLGPAGEWVPEYYPVKSSERTPDGLRVTLPVASREWATSLLLRLGEAVLDARPVEFRDAATAEARAALRHYG